MYSIYFMLLMRDALSFKICKVCFKILPNVFIKKNRLVSVTQMSGPLGHLHTHWLFAGV